MNFRRQRPVTGASSRENAPARLSGPINGVSEGPRTLGFRPEAQRGQVCPTVGGMPVSILARNAEGQPWQPPRTGPRPRVLVAKTRAYLDTVVVHFHTLPESIAEIRHLLGVFGDDTRLLFEEVSDNHGWLVILHQPTRKELHVLGRLQRRTSNHAQPATLHRYDVSVDFFPSDLTSLEELERWLRQTVTVKNSERHRTRMVETTWYSGPEGSAFLLAEYADLPSKLDHELSCVHFDLRVTGSEAVRRTGHKYADDLINLNPALHWDRHVRHLEYDVEEFTRILTERDMRKRRAIRKRLGKQPSKTNPLYRESRVRGLVKRLELHSVHNLRVAFPIDVTRLAIIPTANFGLPKKLQWGAISLGKDYTKKVDTEF